MTIEIYDPNSLEATRPLEAADGKLTIYLYDQGDVLRPLIVSDTRFNRQFAVWARKFDRK